MKYYKKIQKQIFNNLINKCHEIGNEFIKKCELFINHELQNWHSFCSIDTENLRYERFEEMNIVPNKFLNEENVNEENSVEELSDED
uniref:Uncharacterized protein n=1 Tax=Meloidogyne enterolobii TaxID=390850 RepID=A0A6V7W1E8_MELEN|nr:unnamed protein product [Meloidogyne enterolobii]